MSELADTANDTLRIGQLVKLCLRVHDEAVQFAVPATEGVRAFKSRVEDLLPDHIVVAWPTSRGAEVQVSVGQNVTVEVHDDRGVLQLHSSIIAKRVEPFPVLYVGRTGKWTKQQSRLNVRLHDLIVPSETLLVLARRELDREFSHDEANAILTALRTGRLLGEPFDARIHNLSAGGILLAAVRPLERGNIIRIKIPLESSRMDIVALATAVWTGEEPISIGYCYRAGCKFVGLGAREQDAITKHIFAKQVELRRRGLL